MRFRFRICNSWRIYHRNTFWSFEPDWLQFILRRASKDGSKTPRKSTKRTSKHGQIEYLLRRRAAFKGVVTKNSKKAKDIISEKGGRTVPRTVKERVFQALQDASKITQDVIALQSDDVNKQAESEEWLDNLQSEVKDIVDSIEEVLRKPWRWTTISNRRNFCGRRCS